MHQLVHRNLTLVLLAFVSGTYAHPFAWLHRPTASTQADRGWLWAWTWGQDAMVSIVDRSPAVTFLSRPAAFGAELNDPLLGYVIPLNSFTTPCTHGSDVTATSFNLPTTHLSPNLGCPKLCILGDNIPEKGESWIALVQRGQCQFVDKAREAQRLGARAVVVGGDDPDLGGNPDTLVNMYSPGDSSDVEIPATFVKYSDYVELSALIAASNTSHNGLKTLSLLVTSEFSAWQWYSPLLTFLTLLLVPSSLTFLTLLIHRIRLARAAQRDRAPEDIVHSLPWRVWTGTGWEKHAGTVPVQDIDVASSRDEDAVERGESHRVPPLQIEEDEDPAWFQSQVECAICLEEFVKGDRVRVLPCKHIFHLDEVDGWLIERKKLCPVCKADVTQPRPPGTHATTQTEEPIQRPTTPAEDPAESSTSPFPSRSTSSSVTERTPLLQNDPSSGTL